jgi:integrase
LLDNCETQMAKGEVKVSADKGWLRLVWTNQGKRFVLTLGLPDSKTNRKVALSRATQIQLDILSGNFDPTLAKYKPSIALTAKKTPLLELLDKFVAYKTKAIDQRTLEKYKTLQMQIADCYGTVTDPDPEAFLEYLEKQGNCKSLIKTKMQMMSACYKWGKESGLVEDNPWERLPSYIRVPPTKAPKPFTAEEVNRILKAFANDRYYQYLYDYVFFLFGTGCRTGEAVGLRWKHLSADCTSLEIAETISRKVGKPPKTNQTRQFRPSPEVTKMLMRRRGENFNKEELVFSSLNGAPIDDHNFRNRAWVKVLEKAEDYLINLKKFLKKSSIQEI